MKSPFEEHNYVVSCSVDVMYFNKKSEPQKIIVIYSIHRIKRIPLHRLIKPRLKIISASILSIQFYRLR